MSFTALHTHTHKPEELSSSHAFIYFLTNPAPKYACKWTSTHGTFFTGCVFLFFSFLFFFFFFSNTICKTKSINLYQLKTETSPERNGQQEECNILFVMFGGVLFTEIYPTKTQNTLKILFVREEIQWMILFHTIRIILFIETHL